MDEKQKNIEGIIFGIQRFSIHDGPGIRTTLFLKGCNVNCAWCHNPEGIPYKQMLSYNAGKCIGCRGCETVCPQKVHTFESVEHQVDRGRCSFCEKCLEICPAEALEVLGEKMKAEEAVKQLLRDKNYFTGEGGITISGGEAMLQHQFVKAVLKGVKEQGVNTALETNGTLPYERYEEVLPYVDVFLVDYKVTDPEVYRKYVGGDNRRVEENIRRLYNMGAKIRIRCPIIPGVNAVKEHFQKIAQLTKELPGLEGAELLPYHKLGISKAARVGIGSTEFEEPSSETVSGWKDYIIGLGGRLVNVD